MDQWLVHLLNGMATHHPVLTTLAELTARDSVYLYAVLLLFLWFAPGRDRRLRRVHLLRALLATGLALLFGNLIGILWYRPRPFVADASIQRLIPHGTDASFPSDHGTLTFGLAVGLLGIRPWVSWFGMLLSFATMASRIYVGVHYPTDMLGGILVALAGHGVVWLLWRYVQPPLQWIVGQWERVERAGRDRRGA